MSDIYERDIYRTLLHLIYQYLKRPQTFVIDIYEIKSRNRDIGSQCWVYRYPDLCLTHRHTQKIKIFKVAFFELNMTSLVTDSQICQEIAPKIEVRALSNPLNNTKLLRAKLVSADQVPDFMLIWGMIPFLFDL